MTKKEQLLRAYLAGVLDGEGCININQMKRLARNGNIYHTLYVTVGTTDNILPQLFHKTFGGSLMTRMVKGYDKPRYIWQVAARKAKKVLLELLPYLKLKKEQAELAIEFATEKQKSPKLWDREKNGNFKGVGLSKERIKLYYQYWLKMKQLHQANRSNSGKACNGNPELSPLRESVTTNAGDTLMGNEIV